MKIKTLCFLLLLSIFSSQVAFADTLTLRPDAPKEYVVVKGDTLWDISAKFLNSPWLWPEVWQLNPEIANPHLIYPGDTIYLTYDKNGRPRLSLQRSGKPTTKLSPTAHASRIDKAIPTIPIDAIQQFLTRGGILTQEEYEKAPYVVAFQDDRLIAATADTAYARKLPADTQTNLYTIVRLGKPYRDPSNNALLGHEVIEVGSAELKANGDPATLMITDSNREVLAGDRLFPAADSGVYENFFPHAPDKEIEGTIIAVLDGVSRIGQYHVIAINKGEQAGVERGHVFAIFQSGRQVRDNITADKEKNSITLPDVEAGHVLVFRTFEKVSYGLIMRARKDLRLYDKIRTPH